VVELEVPTRDERVGQVQPTARVATDDDPLGRLEEVALAVDVDAE
jgi:hypothetical protein